MPVIQTGVFAVMERFSDLRELIKRRFRENEAFQTICDDYLSCAKALRPWNQANSEEAALRKGEYAALLRDLEAEILEILSGLR